MAENMPHYPANFSSHTVPKQQIQAPARQAIVSRPVPRPKQPTGAPASKQPLPPYGVDDPYSLASQHSNHRKLGSGQSELPPRALPPPAQKKQGVSRVQKRTTLPNIKQQLAAAVAADSQIGEPTCVSLVLDLMPSNLCRQPPI
jgi:hypothetical protein